MERTGRRCSLGDRGQGECQVMKVRLERVGRCASLGDKSQGNGQRWSRHEGDLVLWETEVKSQRFCGRERCNFLRDRGQGGESVWQV